MRGRWETRLQQHEETRDGTGEAGAGLQTGGSARSLGGGRRLARGGAGGGGQERRGNRHALGGEDDGGVDGATGGVGVDAGGRSVGGGGGADSGAVGADGRLGRSRRAGRVARGARRGRLDLAVIDRDAELGRVLVLALGVGDQLDPVAVRVAASGRDVRIRGPDVAAAVGDALSDGLVVDHVGGRALQEQQGDGSSGGGGPLDGEGLAGRDDLGLSASTLHLLGARTTLARKADSPH